MMNGPMSAPNELKIEHYVLGNTIGIGAFGKVKSNNPFFIQSATIITLFSLFFPWVSNINGFLVARHEFTNNNVAIKIVNKKRMRDKNMGGRIKREIQLLRYFNHPNIIRL